MTDLVARLREAIDETERVAREADGGTWIVGPTFGGRDNRVYVKPEGFGIDTIGTCIIAGQVSNMPQYRANATHIALHDPERELRRCAADRKILDPHVPMQWAFKWVGPTDDRQRVPDMRCSACWTDYDPEGKYDHECHHGPHDWPCATVLALAEAYGVEA